MRGQPHVFKYLHACDNKPVHSYICRWPVLFPGPTLLDSRQSDTEDITSHSGACIHVSFYSCRIYSSLILGMAINVFILRSTHVMFHWYV